MIDSRTVDLGEGVAGVRRWVIGGAVVVVVVLVGTLVFHLRGTTRFDERAYSGSSWDMTPEAVFTDFDLVFPECTDGRMRYWSGSLELYVRITAPSDCVDQFIEANRLKSGERAMRGPVILINSAGRAAEFGWQSSADRKYTRYRREETWKSNVETQATADDGAAERSLFLHAWHQ
ncbi:hypothetical protein [Salinispora arenicola]|uniref:Uncharacterized protein n=1 Tax=Salinispora arenicola (strain CNS-205) TaxID=391037 RepID=A8LZV7_SALAI|nr:hypothetical protein [Salinispora arenicola]MCN0180109.1 hypothetical protein [Salinispora arenicola]